jgi:hypothetical protein
MRPYKIPSSFFCPQGRPFLNFSTLSIHFSTKNVRRRQIYLHSIFQMFQTFDENIRWFDARLHDLFELQSSFQFLGGCSGSTRLLGVAESVSFVFHRYVLYCNGPNRFDK